MASHKPFPSVGDYFSPNKETKVCMLINAVYFYLESVFVVIAEDHCRLIIIQSQKLIYDECYDSLRGAKIAFYRMYKEKGCVEGIRNEWSANYKPEKKWLSKKLKTLPQPIYNPRIVADEHQLASSI